MTTSTGITALDRSVQNANTWINDLSAELGESRETAYRVLRAFLPLLRDRLTVDEAAHVAAQLPHLWRGVYYAGWVPSRTPETYRDHDTLLQRLAEHAQLAGPTEASLAAEACAKVLRAHIDEGEFRHIRDVLPESLLALFE